MSRFMTKPTEWSVRQAKTQISLGIHPVWSEFSLCAHWVAKDPSFLHADSEDSDQTGRMPRLISLRWAHKSFCWFCHEAAQIMHENVSSNRTSGNIENSPEFCCSSLIRSLTVIIWFIFRPCPRNREQTITCCRSLGIQGTVPTTVPLHSGLWWACC